MSDSGLLVFQEKNGSNSQGFRSIEGALRKLDELGWGEPPHIDEVFKDAQETSRKLGEVGGSSSWDAGSILRELQGKWRELSQS